MIATQPSSFHLQSVPQIPDTAELVWAANERYGKLPVAVRFYEDNSSTYLSVGVRDGRMAFRIDSGVDGSTMRVDHLQRMLLAGYAVDPVARQFVSSGRGPESITCPSVDL